MTKVSIHPVAGPTGDVAYHAIAGDKQSLGKTAGEALDALENQLPPDESQTLVIVQRFKPDRFFTAAQQQRLTELLERWRTSLATGVSLPPDQFAELEALIQADLNASADRTADLLQKLGQ